MPRCVNRGTFRVSPEEDEEENNRVNLCFTQECSGMIRANDIQSPIFLKQVFST